MLEKPLLILPKLGPPLPRKKQSIFPREYIRLPSRQEQAHRFMAKFESMKESVLDCTPDSKSIENILVLETVGKIENFKEAANKIPGLEWQAEVDIDDSESDTVFFELPKIGVQFLKKKTSDFETDESKEIHTAFKNNGLIDEDNRLKENYTIDEIKETIPDKYKDKSDIILESIEKEQRKSLQGRLYLSLSNRQALSQVKSLFDAYQKGEDPPQLTSTWKDLFSHLKDVRYWDVEDRVRETGVLEYWKEEVELKRGTASMISFEIELSYSDDPAHQSVRQEIIQNLVLEEGGRILATCIIPEIRFHALKVDLPSDTIERVLNKQYGNLFRSGGIMFFRPSAQCSTQLFPNGELSDIGEITPPIGAPIVALLDGMPLANHTLLNGFLDIDDPDNFFEDYEPNEFSHGTAMASLICHGELDSGDTPLSRKIYVRPILKPESIFNSVVERIPNNVFFEDLLERSVRRMFEHEGDEPPAAPTIKVINLSVADSNRIFHRIMGPTSKLLDWLSYKYGVLFCVSSGNVINTIHLDAGDKEFNDLNKYEQVGLTLSSINQNKRNRRLFSPSEAINIITVRALHDDCSEYNPGGNRIDILPKRILPSPLSVTGHGFRSAIKPELLVPGGRQLYENIGEKNFKLSDSPEPPGQRVAAGPVFPGEINRTVYTRGTSNSTALATRAAALIYDSLEELFSNKGEELPEKNIAPLLKTLLVHGASWGESANIVSSALNLSGHNKQKELARFLGYGIPDFNKSIECSVSRATAIGYGTLKKDERHEFRLPLPNCLSGENVWRRLTITLSWLSPTGPETRKYRRAQLTFDPKGFDQTIGGKRNEAQWQQVKNGTIQHEVFEGKKVVAFIQGEYLLIPVQCREDAGTLDSEIPYGMAITLEAKDNIKIPIYEEIREGIDILIREQIVDKV